MTNEMKNLLNDLKDVLGKYDAEIYQEGDPRYGETEQMCIRIDGFEEFIVDDAFFDGKDVK